MRMNLLVVLALLLPGCVYMQGPCNRTVAIKTVCEKGGTAVIVPSSEH